MWARIVSIVFHPLFIPTYFFLFLSRVAPTALEPVAPVLQPKFLLFIFLVTCVIPVLNLGLIKAFGGFRTFAMPARKERLLPFALISVIYIAVTYMFYVRGSMNLHDNFLRFFLTIDLLIVAATVATFFFKVSVHSVAVWGLIGILIRFNQLTNKDAIFFGIVVVTMVAGVVMAARLQVGAHTLREVMWGAVLGLITGFGGMLLLFNT